VGSIITAAEEAAEVSNPRMQFIVNGPKGPTMVLEPSMMGTLRLNVLESAPPRSHRAA